MQLSLQFRQISDNKSSFSVFIWRFLHVKWDQNAKSRKILKACLKLERYEFIILEKLHVIINLDLTYSNDISYNCGM